MSRVGFAPWAVALWILSIAPAGAQTAPEPGETPPPPPVAGSPAEAAEPEETPEPAAPPLEGIFLRVGIAGIVLPEASRGTFSAQPELRIGWYTSADLAIQVEGSVRVWPLGVVAARSYGVAGNVLWFPPFNEGRRDFYLLAGAGGYYTDPVRSDSSFDPAVRGGVGFVAPLSGLSPALASVRLAAEYRGEFLLADETDFVSGIALGLMHGL